MGKELDGDEVRDRRYHAGSVAADKAYVSMRAPERESASPEGPEDFRAGVQRERRESERRVQAWRWPDDLTPDAELLAGAPPRHIRDSVHPGRRRRGTDRRTQTPRDTRDAQSEGDVRLATLIEDMQMEAPPGDSYVPSSVVREWIERLALLASEREPSAGSVGHSLYVDREKLRDIAELGIARLIAWRENEDREVVATVLQSLHERIAALEDAAARTEEEKP